MSTKTRKFLLSNHLEIAQLNRKMPQQVGLVMSFRKAEILLLRERPKKMQLSKSFKKNGSVKPRDLTSKRMANTRKLLIIKTLETNLWSKVAMQK